MTFSLLDCFLTRLWGFPHNSAGEETTWNAGDPSLIPGSGRSPGEGVGYPLQYSCASLVAQLVKNLSAMWETWVLYLGWKDPLQQGKATHSSILAWRTSWTIVHGVANSQTQLSDFHFSLTRLLVYYERISLSLKVHHFGQTSMCSPTKKLSKAHLFGFLWWFHCVSITSQITGHWGLILLWGIWKSLFVVQHSWS